MGTTLCRAAFLIDSEIPVMQLSFEFHTAFPGSEMIAIDLIDVLDSILVVVLVPAELESKIDAFMEDYRTRFQAGQIKMPECSVSIVQPPKPDTVH